MSATAIRRSRLPAPKVPAPTFNPATHQSAQDVTAYPGHTFWPITRFTVPHCLRWQADTRYLRFEGLISRSRNIYLRFKGLPKRDIRSMRGHPALESCGFRPGSTRAPTPRNADRCPNEGVVGKAIRESEVPREDIIVASKLPGRHHQYDQARVTIEESVARMGLDYIDLYLIHWPNPSQGQFVEAWQALVDAQKQGIVKHIGVSNFLPGHIDLLIRSTGVTPAVNRVELYPFFQQAGQRAYDQAHGTITEAWSPLGHANQMLKDPTIVRIAAMDNPEGRSFA